jgi:hypothetical protein
MFKTLRMISHLIFGQNTRARLPAGTLRLSEGIWFETLSSGHWDHDAVWYYEKRRFLDARD